MTELAKPTVIPKAIVKGGAARVNPLEAVATLVTAWSEYKQVQNQERTKRRAIDAWEQTTLAQIHGARDVILFHLERTFDERKLVLERMFASLDDAAANNRPEQVAATLESIVRVVESSPFEDLRSVADMKAALREPGDLEL